MHVRGGHLWTALVILGGCGASATAAEPPAGGGAPFQVDTGASRGFIKVASTTRLGHDHGVVGRLASGTVNLGGTGDLVFDMRSFLADRPEARSYVGLTAAISASDAQKTTNTMLGKDVLNVSRHPTARYTFRSAKPLDDQAAGAPGRYQLDGDFTLHGVTRAVPIAAVLEKSDVPGVLRMRCGLAVVQSHYGMRPYSAIGGLVGVADRLDVWGELLIRPSAASTAAVPGSNTAR